MYNVRAYNLSDEEKESIIKNWLGREGLQLIHTLTNTEKDACKSTIGLFDVLKWKFWLQHNEMILSLQYCKLHGKENESTKEWIERLCIKAAKCNYKEHERRFSEQFINSIENEEIM